MPFDTDSLSDLLSTTSVDTSSTRNQLGRYPSSSQRAEATKADQKTNSGQDSQIHVDHVLHPLSADECQVYRTLVNTPGSHITAAPNHFINEHGDIDGFRFDIPATESAALLPVSRHMGFRHACVECVEEHPDFSGENHQILDMLQNQEQILERLKDLVRRMHLEAPCKPPSFDCMPQDSDSTDPLLRLNRAVDSRDWNVEPPSTLGIYHAYVKGRNRDLRSHKLFIIASGGCSKLSHDFYNLVFDARDYITAAQLAESSESWYLSQISHRNAARILNMTAEEFDIQIPTTFDHHSYDPCRIMASCTTETITSCITHKKGRVTIHESSTDPSTSQNGMLFAMHPSEGIWLFKGPSIHNRSSSQYGGAFGHGNPLPCFPIATAPIYSGYAYSSKKNHTVQPRKSGTVAFINHSGVDILDYDSPAYTSVDEAYIQELCSMLWNRDNGLIEFIPIAVVHTLPYTF